MLHSTRPNDGLVSPIVHKAAEQELHVCSLAVDQGVQQLQVTHGLELAQQMGQIEGALVPERDDPQRGVGESRADGVAGHLPSGV